MLTAMELPPEPDPSTIALYYPWVRFRDDNWLKSALLTWDNIARIRPGTIGGEDNEIVKQIRAEADLIIDITPSDADLAAVSDAFEEVVDQSGFQFEWEVPDELVAHEAHILPPPPPGYQGGGTSYTAKDGLVWIYAGRDATGGGKMNQRVQGAFGELGLATPHPRDDQWVGMQPKVALVYLTALADTIAQRNRLCPVTDDPRVHTAAGTLDRLARLLFGNDTEIPRDENPENAYIHLALDAVITPARLADLPVHKLIGFRQRYTAELAAFRQHVATLGPELRAVAQVENVQVAHAHLQAIYDKHTKPQLDELRRALRGVGVESVSGTLDLKVDVGAAAGTLIGAAAAAGGQLTVAGAAVAVAVLPYVVQRAGKARQVRRDSPVAYLLAVDRKLA